MVNARGMQITYYGSPTFGNRNYRGMSNFGNLCCITYLHAAGAGRGGTDVIPSTHRTTGTDMRQYEGPLRLGTTIVEQGKLSRRSVEGLESLLPAVVSPEFAAGDVLMFDSWVLHRADSNATAHSVVGLVNVYCRPDCRPLEPSSAVSLARQLEA